MWTVNFRRLLRLTACVSVIALLLSVGACAASEYVKLDWVASAGWRLYIGQNHVCWYGYDGGNPPGIYFRGRDYSLGLGDSPAFWGEDIFGVKYAEVPLGWVVLTLMLIVAALACGAHLLTRRLVARGMCARCGYDLQGNMSGRCPECGTPIRRSADSCPNAPVVLQRPTTRDSDSTHDRT